MKLSIIIPALNEDDNLLSTLKSLDSLKKHNAEILLVDGGSHDNTKDIARPFVSAVLTSEAGRARQMNHGAKHASGDILWFLHADSLIPDNAFDLINSTLKNHVWGRFDIKLSSSKFVFRIIEKLINARSRLTGIATGDQGIFILKKEFEHLNGYADIPLMEDIDISKRLKKMGSPACLKQTITTSSRRWESNGVVKTVFLMWYLRLAYSLGVPATKLACIYRNK